MSIQVRCRRDLHPTEVVRYEQAVEYISRIPKFTKKNEAGNTIELLRRLSHPEREFRVIHVAGTNGKGSVCAFLESIFRKAGYRTGLFTSPHLVRINERFQTDRTPVSDEDFLEAFLRVMRAVEEMMADGYAHPTYFEFLFAAGMWYFREQKIDILLCETGLGIRNILVIPFRRLLLRRQASSRAACRWSMTRQIPGRQK